MANYEHLLVERKACILQADQIDKKATRENRSCTVEETDQIDGLLAKAKQLQLEWDESPQPRQTRQEPPDNSGFFGGGSTPPRSVLGRDGGSVADRMFGKQFANGGFSSFGDWLQAMDSGLFDTRLQAANKVGVDSEGGFLVPQVYANAYIDAVIESSVLLKRVRKVPMASDTLNLSGWDGNNHSSNLFGGFTAAWEEELSSLSPQTAKTRRVTLNAKKLVILTQASNELVADATMYEDMLGSALVQAMAWQLDYEILRGSGAGRPLGCVDSDSAIEIAKESSQTASTIWFTNVVKMLSRLHPSSYNTSVWIANPTCIPQLMTLDVHESATALGSGLVGDATYNPFRESDGKFTLFGRPVIFTEKLPTLGTKGDIILVDPSQYVLGMRQEIVVEKSAHAGFTTDSSYYRAKLRTDGRPLWQNAMTPKNGDSLSWCVTLAKRS